MNSNGESRHDLLLKLLKVTLRDEDSGYYWIFTNSTLDGNKLTGNINDEGGHGKHSKSEVEKRLKEDKVKIDRKLDLLKKAIGEFNKENNSDLKFTYKLNSPSIKTNNWKEFGRTYDSESLIATVTIQ